MADFTLGPGASDPLKDFVSAIQKYSRKGPEGSALRKSGFSKADVNGSGMASLAEVENFINFALQEALDDDDDGTVLFKLFRSSYITAFNLAKNLGKNDGKVLSGFKTATADDYISFPEFRMFCVYAIICAAMYDVFTLVDGESKGISEDDDSRISLDEFLGGWQALGGLGFMALQGIDSAEEATALFKAVDTNDGGFILFREWAAHIKQEEIKAKTHVGTLLSGNLKATKIVKSKSSPSVSTPRSKTRPVQTKAIPVARGGSQARSRATSRSTGSAPAKTGMPLPAAIDGVYKPASTSKELKEFIKCIQPYTGKTADGKKLRKHGFGKCDMNGSGECSLAEVDSFVLTNLKADYGPKLGGKLFKSFRHAYIVAYNAAKDLKSSSKGNDDDYINFSEFRVLNVYLCIYTGMLDAFATVDGGGAGVSKDDDRRIGKKEWMKGYSRIKNTGFLGLSQLNNDDDAIVAFQSMDADNSGRMLFDDFCNYLSAAEVDANTKLGALFSGNGLRLRALNRSTPDDATPPPQDLPEEGSVGEDEEPEETQEEIPEEVSVEEDDDDPEEPEEEVVEELAEEEEPEELEEESLEEEHEEPEEGIDELAVEEEPEESPEEAEELQEEEVDELAEEEESEEPQEEAIDELAEEEEPEILQEESPEEEDEEPEDPGLDESPGKTALLDEEATENFSFEGVEQ